MILEHLSSTQNDFIFSKKFLANSLDPESSKCRPRELLNGELERETGDGA